MPKPFTPINSIALTAQAINIKLIAAEQSLKQYGPVNQTADEMLAEFKAQFNSNT